MKLDPQHLIFYLGSFVVPVLLVLLNFIVRWVKRWYYTAGSDFLLTLMTFSFSAAVMAKDISPYMRNQDLRVAAGAIFLVLGLLILLCWFWTVSVVEQAINETIEGKIALSIASQVKVMAAWGLVVTFCFCTGDSHGCLSLFVNNKPRHGFSGSSATVGRILVIGNIQAPHRCSGASIQPDTCLVRFG